MSSELEKIIKQNEIIIALLGRIAFKPAEIQAIVIERKKKPENYINGYNACDGNHSLSEIAEIVGVALGTLSPILSEWEQIGIVYEIDKPGGKYYKKILPV
ncbi:MAG: hypothetical protein ACFFER_15130 [Candidatus Thorarchaeota archaeon]